MHASHAALFGASLIALAGCDALTGASASRGADLAVSFVDAVRNTADTFTFSATLVNQGNGRAAPSAAQLSIDAPGGREWEILSGFQRIGMLSPGSTVPVQWSNAGTQNVFEWDPKSGKHRARVCADAGDEKTRPSIAETNETNNCKIIEFIVR